MALDVRGSAYESWTRVCVLCVSSPFPCRTSASILLPALPDFSPTGDEYLHITIPEYMVESGGRIQLPYASILIKSSRHDCVLSPWSEWGACSGVCTSGTQARSRTITTQPSSSGLPCLATTEQRTCNTCNPCSVVQCSNGGQCVSGTCFCTPGWGGESCAVPAFSTANLAYTYIAGPWSSCSFPCGDDGTRVRDVECQAVSATGATTVDLSVCEAALDQAPPNITTECNRFSCAPSVLSVSGNLSLPLPLSAVTFSSAVTASFFTAFSAELAALMGLPASQVETTGVQANGNDGILVLFQILPAPEGEAEPISPPTAVGTLASKLAGGVTAGTFVPSAVSSSLAYTVYAGPGGVVGTGSGEGGVDGKGGSGSGAARLAPGWIAAIVFAMLAFTLVVVAAILLRRRAAPSRILRVGAAMAVPDPSKPQFNVGNPAWPRRGSRMRMEAEQSVPVTVTNPVPALMPGVVPAPPEV